MKENLKTWNGQVVGNVDRRKESLLEELQGLERREKGRTPSEAEILRNGSELERVILMKEIL